MSTPETHAVQARYARRDRRDDAQRYSLYANAAALQAQQERLRAMACLWRLHGWASLADRPLLEVGCGSGGNLLDLLRLGLLPAHLSGIELLPERLAAARAALPEGVRLLAGDASKADIAPASQDLVLQSTVFSSILDDGVQQGLAEAMWRWLRPGGALLWYDFIVDNPRNRDVRGVPLRRVRELFPQGRLQAQRLTLAPPLARWVCRAHPAAYTVFNSIPWLRTHVLAVIEKSA